MITIPRMGTTSSNIPTWVATAVLTATLAACGGGTASDPILLSAETIRRRMPVPSEVSADWTDEGEPFVRDLERTEGPFVGVCGGPSFTGLAMDQGVQHVVKSANFWSPEGSYGSFLVMTFPSDAEATAMLRTVLDGRGGDETEQILMRLERDPRSVRSRMLYFAACDAAALGDAAAHRGLLEESLATQPKDVDSLIAWYRLAAEPAARADAAARVALALEQIEEEIQAVPDDPNGYNEYAWLVANTGGDVGKALRYSKRSLELSFDNASFLDTLAHCHAAAGRHAAAVRTQRLAKRYEPHNHTIQRNLERFEKLAP